MTRAFGSANQEGEMKRALFGALLVAATVAVPASAQYRVPQQTSSAMNEAERANLQLVHDWWRDIMQGHNLDIASHYMPADFISRNPNVPAAGREPFIKVLRTRPDLLQNYGQHDPEVQFAKNDYVFLMWANFVPDPTWPARIYKYDTFDLVRVANGKVVEHWDGAHKSVPGDFGAKNQGGGVYHTSTNLTPEEQQTLKLGMVEFRDILQYGHTELALQAMAPTYMQHNPNVPGGRDGFVKNFSSRPKKPLEDKWVTPPTLELISGDFYLKFDQRLEPDPTDKERKSVFYRFDMVRVDDGLIQEHWDVAYPNGIPRP
jgi:predicted SnoaL-like aldol condensation-catalyzing enzyme